MPKKMTQEEAKNVLNELGFELISEYRGFTDKINLKCYNNHTLETTMKNIKKSKNCPVCKKENKEKEIIYNVEKREMKLLKYWNEGKHIKVECICSQGHIATMSYDNILSGSKCKFCQRKAMPSMEYMKEYIEKEGYKLLVDIIPNATTKFGIICPHGHEYKVNWNKFSSGRRCPYCANKVKLTLEKVSLIFKNEGYEIIGEYKDTITPVTIRCKCGNEYSVTVGNFKQGKRCSKCNSKSKGEDKIFEILDLNKIEYIRQQKYVDCKDINMLPFDFYLPQYNLIIEYDGEQHFKPISVFGGEDVFWTTVTHDAIKNQYCEDNDIDLLRIPYWEFDNIEKLIKDKLNSLK